MMKGVLITGASSGLGRQCALHLAAKGYRVFAGVRREADGESLRAEAAEGLEAVIIDVTDAESIARAVARVEQTEEGLYGLVNNAGITVAGPVELLPLDALRRQFEVNLFGQVAVIKAFLPLLRAAEGRIILMSSILGKFSLPFLAPYSASKFALEALTDSLAIELKPHRIRVSTLEPGNISTPIWSKTKERADEMFASAPSEEWARYDSDLKAFERYTAHAAATGISPQRVALAVERVLAARRPRSRYAVGWDARILGRFAQVIPASLRQALVSRMVLRR